MLFSSHTCAFESSYSASYNKENKLLNSVKGQIIPVVSCTNVGLQHSIWLAQIITQKNTALI